MSRQQIHALKRLLLADAEDVWTADEVLRMMSRPEEWFSPHLRLVGVEAKGRVAQLLKALEGEGGYELLPQPAGLRGQLRPYQCRGYSWLAYLTRWGLGACLADDMGLGKTVQALALIQRNWELGERRPVLVVCPTSVISNWRHEAAKFTPDLPVLVHHGPERSRGGSFRQGAESYALVITSYSLLQRDVESLSKVNWAGVILDEAQKIKNPRTKQAKAARALPAGYRVALTGTPVENHVGELWSIMEFLNPGYLGSWTKFRQEFAAPAAEGDPEALDRLRKLVRPFILRREKTDPTIVVELPEKLEMKVYCGLTREQAELYRSVLAEATGALESASGMKRRGLILATLTKLKQICNHPVNYLRDGSALGGRSGKLALLADMLEEVLDLGESALIFTQFREMGEILKRHLQQVFGVEVLFLHGGVPRKRRDEMVARFEQADGPVLFVLSLKAGGTGLNLARANHVFHYDRWWNPAVENQATDRAHRIGQRRSVQVHKLICAGTLEEAIDDMIERKKELADRVVAAGEEWLTELSNEELRRILQLRVDAVLE